MKKQISPEVINVLKSARCEGSKLFLDGQLDRKLYTDTMKIIGLLGGKWTGRLGKGGHHAFDGDCAERIDEAVMTGSIVDSKKLFQFFETPKRVAHKLVGELDLFDGARVLEPSAGKGRLVSALMDEGVLSISVCELDPVNVKHLLSTYTDYVSVIGADFMELPESLKFDRIVMNPPFRNGQDVKHVTKAFRHLNDSGRLVAIMSPAFQYRDSGLHSGFRDLLEREGAVIDEIPAGEFSESGTEIRTVMVTLLK